MALLSSSKPWVAIVAVAFLAILLGSFPQRDLDWEGTILPLAQAYADVSLPSGGDASSLHNATHPLEGKVVVITGCTAGIGLALTRAVSRLGATVVGIGRSPHKLAKVRQELPPEKFHGVLADFSNLDTVAKAADEIVGEFPTIDMLINNAGVHDSFSNLWGTLVSAQGFDRVFAVNYLSHFLLTEKLAPSLHNATKPTVLQISSSFHWAVDGSDLMTTNDDNDSSNLPLAARAGGAHGYILFRSTRSYANSKLAQIYHARTLQRRHALLSSPKVRIVSACPAWVATNIGGETGLFRTILQMGFPMEGWGIASSLVALLDYHNNNNNNGEVRDDAANNDLTSTASSPDFYVNTKVFLWLFALPPWIFQNALRVREVTVCILAQVAMPVQRFGAFTGTTTSSPESYNVTIADSLYDWSYQAVQKWL